MSTAWAASSERFSPIPASAEKSNCPLPVTRPPLPASAANCWICNREPWNVPDACTLVSTVPVVALSIRAPLVRSIPRIEGSETRPVTSAPSAIGPDIASISSPLNRHNVSAGPL